MRTPPTRPFASVTSIRGLLVPADIRFRQIIVTGPPGSGKSRIIEQLRGWPLEGYLDLTRRRWWRDPCLNVRPREVHLGLPFRHLPGSHAVTDPAWLAAPGDLDETRIVLPPERTRLSKRNLRRRYAFDVQLIPAPLLFSTRVERAASGLFPKDIGLTLETVVAQVRAYTQLAAFLHQHRVLVYVRDRYGGPPLRLCDS